MNFDPQTAFRKQPMVYLVVALFFVSIHRKYSKLIIIGAQFINSILWPWVLDKK